LSETARCSVWSGPRSPMPSPMSAPRSARFGPGSAHRRRDSPTRRGPRRVARLQLHRGRRHSPRARAFRPAGRAALLACDKQAQPLPRGSPRCRKYWSVANPTRRFDSRRASSVTGDAFRTAGSRTLSQDRLRVRLRWCRERTAAATRSAAATRDRPWREERLSAVQPDGRLHDSHGRANRAVAGEAARKWDARCLLVRLETARRAAQPADPGQGTPSQSFAG